MADATARGPSTATKGQRGFPIISAAAVAAGRPGASHGVRSQRAGLAPSRWPESEDRRSVPRPDGGQQRDATNSAGSRGPSSTNRPGRLPHRRNSATRASRCPARRETSDAISDRRRNGRRAHLTQREHRRPLVARRAGNEAGEQRWATRRPQRAMIVVLENTVPAARQVRSARGSSDKQQRRARSTRLGHSDAIRRAWPFRHDRREHRRRGCTDRAQCRQAPGGDGRR